MILTSKGGEIRLLGENSQQCFQNSHEIFDGRRDRKEKNGNAQTPFPIETFQRVATRESPFLEPCQITSNIDQGPMSSVTHPSLSCQTQSYGFNSNHDMGFKQADLVAYPQTEEESVQTQMQMMEEIGSNLDEQIVCLEMRLNEVTQMRRQYFEMMIKDIKKEKQREFEHIHKLISKGAFKQTYQKAIGSLLRKLNDISNEISDLKELCNTQTSCLPSVYYNPFRASRQIDSMQGLRRSYSASNIHSTEKPQTVLNISKERKHELACSEISPRNPQFRIPFNDVKLLRNSVSPKIRENQLTISQILHNYRQAQGQTPFVSSNIQDNQFDRDLELSKKSNSSSCIQQVPVESLTWQEMNCSLKQGSSLQQAPQDSQLLSEQLNIQQYNQLPVESCNYYQSPQFQQFGNQHSNTALEEQPLMFQVNCSANNYNQQNKNTMQDEEDDSNSYKQASQQQVQVQRQKQKRNFAEASVQTSFSLTKGFGSYFNARNNQTSNLSASQYPHSMDDEYKQKVLQSAILLAASIPSQHDFPNEGALYHDQSQLNQLNFQQQLASLDGNPTLHGSTERMDKKGQMKSFTYSPSQNDSNACQNQEISQISNSKLFSAQKMKDSYVSSRYSQQSEANQEDNQQNIDFVNQKHNQVSQSEYEKKDSSTTGLTTTSWNPQSVERDFSGVKQKQQGNQVEYSMSNSNSVKQNTQTCLKSEEQSRLEKSSDDKTTQCFEDIIKNSHPTSTLSQQQTAVQESDNKVALEQDQLMRFKEEELKRQEAHNTITPEIADQQNQNHRKNNQNPSNLNLTYADSNNKGASLQSPPTSLFQYANPADTNIANNNSRSCELPEQYNRYSHTSINQGECTNASEIDFHFLNSAPERLMNGQYQGTHLERLNHSNTGRIRGQQRMLNPNVLSWSQNKQNESYCNSKQSADIFHSQTDPYYVRPESSSFHTEQGHSQMHDDKTNKKTVLESPQQQHHSLSLSNGNRGQVAGANYSSRQQGQMNNSDSNLAQKQDNQDQVILYEGIFLGQVKARIFVDQEENNFFYQHSASNQNEEEVDESGFINCDLLYKEDKKQFTLLAHTPLLPQIAERSYILNSFPLSLIFPQCLEIVSSPNNEPSLQIVRLGIPSPQVCFILLQACTDSDSQMKRQFLEHLRNQIQRILLSSQTTNGQSPEIMVQLNESDSFTQNPLSAYKEKHLNQSKREHISQIQQKEVMEAGTQNNEIRNSIKSKCSDLESSKQRYGQDFTDSIIITSKENQLRQKQDQIFIPQEGTLQIQETNVEISMEKSKNDNQLDTQGNIGRVISEKKMITQRQIDQQKETNSSPYENLKRSQKQNLLSSIQKVAEDDDDDEVIRQAQSQINEFKAIQLPIHEKKGSFQQNRNLPQENNESMQVVNERASEIIKANQPHFLMFNHHRYQVFTGRTQEEEQMINFFKKFDEREFIMKKYGQNSSSPQLRRLFFSSDFRFFCWKSPNQPDIKRIIPIYMIGNYILHGRSTDNFKRYKNLKQSQIDCCFSIIMENRTIDLEALSLDDKDLFIQGLQFVFIAFQ